VQGAVQPAIAGARRQEAHRRDGRLERRLIQLRIEREAVKKETDEASRKRLSLIEEEISRLEKDYADLEEEWKAEKAQVQGSQHIKEEIEKLRQQMAEFQRKGQYDKLAELQYGRLPQLGAQLKVERLNAQTLQFSESHAFRIRTALQNRMGWMPFAGNSNGPS